MGDRHSDESVTSSRRARHAYTGEPPEQERAGGATLVGDTGHNAGAQPGMGMRAVRYYQGEFKTLGRVV